MTMPRPPIILCDDQVREVETLAALLSQEQIADYFGICRTTFRAICARDEEVRVRYKRGKAKAIAHVANGLLQKARTGDTTSSIFYLKTQAGWRERDREDDRRENQEADQNSYSDEELARMLNFLFEDVARNSTRIGVDRHPTVAGEES
ncbi:hypothetical protein [Oceanicola sp. 22II-s10i]|uniref:hypothetical protein n=1 Tax=Oceanicola sp. 22II-s10i TaxID=1317116 RepID=UPI0020CE3035|nr:hypothetical protein [Oceanicola sp. 22II-s10i]